MEPQMMRAALSWALSVQNDSVNPLQTYGGSTTGTTVPMETRLRSNLRVPEFRQFLISNYIQWNCFGCRDLQGST